MRLIELHGPGNWSGLSAVSLAAAGTEAPLPAFSLPSSLVWARQPPSIRAGQQA